MGKQDCESILLVLLYPVSPPEKDSSHSLIGTTPVNSTIGYIVNDPGKWFSPQEEVLRALGDPRLQDGKFRTRLASKVFFLDPFSFVSVAPGFSLVHSLSLSITGHRLSFFYRPLSSPLSHSSSLSHLMGNHRTVNILNRI